MIGDPGAEHPNKYREAVDSFVSQTGVMAAERNGVIVVVCRSIARKRRRISAIDSDYF